MEPKEPKPRKQAPFNALKFWAISLQTVLAAALLGLFGHWLDDFLQFTFPIFTLVGIFAGLSAAVFQLLKSLKNK